MRVLKLLSLALFLNGFYQKVILAQDKLTNQNTAPVVAARNREYRPISGRERFKWFVSSTIGPENLAAGVVSAGWGTAFDTPKEYGPHWKGFAERYGMRMTGVVTANAIEAGLGRLWGEDPRYFRSVAKRPLPRLRHAAVAVFIAPRADGTQTPAFARYAGIVGNNFISNTWHVPSDSSASAALTGSALGFAGRFASNVFSEFWQDIRHKTEK